MSRLNAGKRQSEDPRFSSLPVRCTGQHAPKGVFLTTSAFSQEARDYVARIDVRIVLIDGQELARLMIRHGVGVNTVTTYELRRADTDYFTEE
jgi:restriction system protein